MSDEKKPPYVAVEFQEKRDGYRYRLVVTGNSESPMTLERTHDSTKDALGNQTWQFVAMDEKLLALAKLVVDAQQMEAAVNQTLADHEDLKATEPSTLLTRLRTFLARCKTMQKDFEEGWALDAFLAEYGLPEASKDGRPFTLLDRVRMLVGLFHPEEMGEKQGPFVDARKLQVAEASFDAVHEELERAHKEMSELGVLEHRPGSGGEKEQLVERIRNYVRGEHNEAENAMKLMNSHSVPRFREGSPPDAGWATRTMTLAERISYLIGFRDLVNEAQKKLSAAQVPALVDPSALEGTMADLCTRLDWLLSSQRAEPSFTDYDKLRGDYRLQQEEIRKLERHLNQMKAPTTGTGNRKLQLSERLMWAAQEHQRLVPSDYEAQIQALNETRERLREVEKRLDDIGVPKTHEGSIKKPEWRVWWLGAELRKTQKEQGKFQEDIEVAHRSLTELGIPKEGHTGDGEDRQPYDLKLEERINMLHQRWAGFYQGLSEEIRKAFPMPVTSP